MSVLRSLVLIQAAAAGAAAETSDRTLIDKQIKGTKSGGAGFAAKPLAIPRCCPERGLPLKRLQSPAAAVLLNLFTYYCALSIRFP